MLRHETISFFFVYRRRTSNFLELLDKEFIFKTYYRVQQSNMNIVGMQMFSVGSEFTTEISKNIAVFFYRCNILREQNNLSFQFHSPLIIYGD